MQTSYINIDDKWGIIFIYDFNRSDDADLIAIMRSFGMSHRKVNEAIKILDTYNSGMTVSNDGLRMSAVFIGKATSTGQFWNTCAHEAKHAADAIIDYYGVEWDGEQAAYLSGYLFQRIVEEVAEPCY